MKTKTILIAIAAIFVLAFGYAAISLYTSDETDALSASDSPRQVLAEDAAAIKNRVDELAKNTLLLETELIYLRGIKIPESKTRGANEKTLAAIEKANTELGKRSESAEKHLKELRTTINDIRQRLNKLEANLRQ